MNSVSNLNDFADSRLLWLLLLIPLCLLWYILKNKRSYSFLQLSMSSGLNQRPTLRISLRHLMISLRLMACTALILAIARPQNSSSSKNINSEGIDILITLDVSGSMLAADVKPNRLEAAKQVADSFITRRPNDRIGLVLFAEQAFTASPVTIDHDALMQIVNGVHTMAMANGTAIGMGLGTAVNHLKESKSSSRVIILITDGENNTGTVQPLESAQLAYEAGIRVYTIGLLLDKTETGVDARLKAISSYLSGSDLLRRISDVTHGRFFLADDKKELGEVFHQIDQLEKTRIDVQTFTRYEDSFYPLAILALLLLLTELLLRLTIYKSILS